MSDRILNPSNGLSKTKLEDTTALVSDVLSGKTFYSGDDTLKSGTMTNRGTWNSTINPGASVTIPAGYHSGSGKVTANSSQADLILVFGGIHNRIAGNFTGTSYMTGRNNEFNTNISGTSDFRLNDGSKHFKITFTVKKAGRYKWLSAGAKDTGQGWHTIRYNGTSHDAPSTFTVNAKVGDTFECEHVTGSDWSYWAGACVYLGS